MVEKGNVDKWRRFKENYQIRSGLFSWYKFRPHTSMLEINPEEGVLTSFFAKKVDCLTCLIDSDSHKKAINSHLSDYSVTYIKEIDKNKKYDYIVAVDPFPYYLTDNEVQDKYIEWENCLSSEGTLILVVNNIFSSLKMAGIRNSYRREDSLESLYSGLNPIFKRVKPYYIFPDYIFPQDIYTNEIKAGRDIPETVITYSANINESRENLKKFYKESFNLFEPNAIAGSFLIECTNGDDQSLNNNLRIKIASGRGERSLYTVINREDVAKFSLGGNNDNLRILAENLKSLKESGVKVIEYSLEGNQLIMPRVYSPLLTEVIGDAAETNRELFFNLIDKLYEAILKSSTHVNHSKIWNDTYGDKDWGPILNKAYIEMTPLNCFYDEGELLFFDQEYTEVQCPAKFVLYRCIEHIKLISKEEKWIVSLDDVKLKYNLTESWETFERKEAEFLDKIFKNDNISNFVKNFHIANQYDYWNYPRISTQLLAYLLEEINHKRIVCYGAGWFYNWFMNVYGKYCNVLFIVSNNKEEWGNYIEGVKICPPTEIIKDKHRIVITRADTDEAINELIALEITDYKVIYKNEWN